MGKFLDKFRKRNKIANKIDYSVSNTYNKIMDNKKYSDGRIQQQNPQKISDDMFDGIDEFNEFNNIDNIDEYGVGIQPPQKPESFHHYILENKYQDLEKSIRGYKDVYNKTTREWETKRKDMHCFTDEEAEEILRTAQSLLATDIKLSFINKEVFGFRMMMLYKRISQVFREIAEYKYGRYSHDDKGQYKPNGYSIEQSMKLQNLKIFVELTERIVANYSRAIAGMENKLTHQSVSSQESLQSSGQFENQNRRYS